MDVARVIPLGEWAREAVGRAARGEVSDENLRALLGPAFEAGDPWDQARAAFAAVIGEIGRADRPAVGKLILPLEPRDTLVPELPDLMTISGQVDRRTPPSLVVHPPLVRRDWADTEEYRRPLREDVFLGGDGQSLAQGLFIAFRTRWEIEDESPFRRSLLFESVRP